MIKYLIPFLLITFAWFSICGAATESLINIRPDTGHTLMQGATIALPDGSQTVIIERRSDGSFVTSNNLIISQNGLLESGVDKGQQIRVLESGFTPGATIKLPNGEQTTIRERLSNQQLVTENGFHLLSDGKMVEEEFDGKSATLVSPGYVPGAQIRLPDGVTTEISEILPDGALKTKSGALLTEDGKVASGASQGSPVELAKAPQKETREARAAKDKNKGESRADKAGNRPEQQAMPEAAQSGAAAGKSVEDILASNPPAENKSVEDILASSPGTGEESVEDILGSMPALAENEHTGRGKGSSEGDGSQKGKQAREARGHSKAEQSGKTQAGAKAKGGAGSESGGKSEKKGAEKSAKPRAGQELRIPPEAAKTGNLDFLEGCWQGTRPEYYTKRIIRECFCFNKGGKGGKRRIFDPAMAGMCVGSTRASLSRDGVLSVYSSGAACTSGDKWGQAEMVCRNSGPRTPCSWVFRDARNGRQSYEIPFVRVNSCKR